MVIRKIKLFFLIIIIEILVLFLGSLALFLPHPDKPWSNRDYWTLLVLEREMENVLIVVFLFSIAWYFMDIFQKR